MEPISKRQAVSSKGRHAADEDPRQHHQTQDQHVSGLQGRNRQVRRMTAAVGFPTLRLVRVGISIKMAQKKNIAPQFYDLRLDSLQPGEYRELTTEEKQIIQGVL